MIALINDEKTVDIGEKFGAVFEKNQIDFKHKLAKEDGIEPCYSCNGCNTKSLGKCVVRDDMDNILPLMAVSDTWLILTPVKWGSPSYTIKKMMDKSALLGDRFYYVKNKELVKGVDVPVERIVMIGVATEKNSREEQDFIFWGNEVANIMNIKGTFKVIDQNSSEDDVALIVSEMGLGTA